MSGCKALSWVNIYYIVNMSSENSLHRNLKSRSVLSGSNGKQIPFKMWETEKHPKYDEWYDLRFITQFEIYS